MLYLSHSVANRHTSYELKIAFKDINTLYYQKSNILYTPITI